MTTCTNICELSAGRLEVVPSIHSMFRNPCRDVEHIDDEPHGATVNSGWRGDRAVETMLVLCGAILIAPDHASEVVI